MLEDTRSEILKNVFIQGKKAFRFHSISRNFPFEYFFSNGDIHLYRYNRKRSRNLTFLQCSKRSILSRKHDVAGVLMLKSVTQRPSSDKCCGWNCCPASHNVAICGSHRGVAPWHNENKSQTKINQIIIQIENAFVVQTWDNIK